MRTLISLKAAFFGCLFLMATGHVQAQTKHYVLDLAKSKLYWKGTPKVGSSHFGYLKFKSGWLDFLDPKMPLLVGEFVIDMRSIKNEEHKDEKKNQGIEKELASASFFEVNKYPLSSISIRKLVNLKGDIYQVSGDLKIKNITHSITFPAQLIRKGNSLEANAELKIDRNKWGIHQQKPTSYTDQFLGAVKNNMVEDEIPIRLSLYFNQK